MFNLAIIKKSKFENMLNSAYIAFLSKNATVNKLLSIQLDSSEFFHLLLLEQEKERIRALGSFLGFAKVATDTAPSSYQITSSIADKNIKDIVRYNTIGKLKPGEVLGTFSEYNFLSKNGTSNISNENFKKFFPGNFSLFVENFARAYSEGFHIIASESAVSTELPTQPVRQDVWKNLGYFLDAHDLNYRLDGVFPFSKKQKTTSNILNADVYEKLKNRSRNFSTISIDM